MTGGSSFTKATFGNQISSPGSYHQTEFCSNISCRCNVSLSELGRANKEVFVKGGSAELCTVKTVQYAPRGRKSFSNERFRQPQKGHFVSSRVSLRTTPADVVKVRCRFNFQKPFERPKIFKNCLCIRFFRCDSISYQLPLSVSGWVIEWFIVSDLEIAIASQSFASFFQWLSFTLIYICYGFIFLFCKT